MRRQRVYRLVVDYPDRPVIDEDAHAFAAPVFPWDEEGFHWPQNRCYLSLTGAQRRAALFERYGANVVIVRSKPIQWEDGTGVDLPKIRRRLRKLLAELQ